MKKLPVLLIFLLFLSVSLYSKERTDISAFSKPSIINQTTRMDVNNIDILLNNAGEYGMESAFYPKGGANTFLFAGGLGVSGYREVDGQDSLVVSWVMAASRIQEFQAGTWGMDPDDPAADLYVVTSQDGPGSEAYVKWETAVSLGAKYVDLDGKPGYDPMTDRPELIGDKLIWTVYNDNLPINLRALGSAPVGVEIQQSFFGFGRGDALGDVLFIKYRIINTLDVDIKDMIFSAIEDPDLGDYRDDLIGCDTTLSLGFIYNDLDDGQYGVNPPAFGIDFFQGPVAVSPGDTAYRYRGPDFGIDTLYDYRNLPLTSFMYYIQGGPANLQDPDFPQEARNYQEGGKFSDGVPIDPQNFFQGSSPGPANPKYIFSGDPVTGEGWLDQTPADKRFMVNCGPFDLAVGDTQDVVLGFVVAQGTDALNSVTKMKETDVIAQTAYNANFLVAGPPPVPGIETRVFEDKIQLLIDLTETMEWDKTDKLLNRQVFEGFEIIQFKSGNPDDFVKEQPNAKVTARFDVNDSINNIYTLNADRIQIDLAWEGLNNLDRDKYKDKDKFFVYEITTDAFTGLPLVPFQEYFFTVVPFSVDINNIYRVNPNSNDYIAPPGAYLKQGRAAALFSVILNNQEDVKFDAFTLDNSSAVSHPSGKSEGGVIVEVIEPTEIKDYDYKVEFFDDGNRWRLINTTLSDTLRDSLQNQTLTGEEWGFPIVDGLAFKVKNEEDRIKSAEAAVANEGDVVWFDGQGTFAASDSGVFNGGINYAKYWVDAIDKGLSTLVRRDQYFPVKIVVDTSDNYLAYRFVTANYSFRDTIRTFIAAYDMTDPDNPRQLNVAVRLASPRVSELKFGTGNTEYIYVMMSSYDETGSAYPDTVNNMFRDAYLVMNFASVADSLFKNNPVEITVEPTYVNSDADVFVVDAGQINPVLTTDERKSLLDKVNVVPNPYFGYSTYETSYDRGIVKFTHLPGEADIRIFNLAGQLVRRIKKNDSNSFIEWDLRNQNRLKVASGLYIAYIDVPGVGTKVIKFAIVQREERIDRY